MKAGQDVYEPGIEHGNFIIREDGKIDSGAGINLYGRNGDIFITDKLGAKQSITAAITEQGSVIFATDVNVTKNVNISTENGFIAVGYTVNAEEGKVNLKTGTGDVLVGKDVTAGTGVDITTDDGSIVIGAVATGDDGDVLARSGDVSIKAVKGNVEIAKTVTAQTGSIDISTGNGEILIGDNGPDVKTVTARENINLETKEGRIVVYGKTSTEEGDITLAARRQEYVSGAANSSFVIDQNGKLEAGRTINLHVSNGDLHISDRIQAKEDLQTELEGKGDVYFDTDVNVAGSLNVKNNEGDINVGGDITSQASVTIQTGTGNIVMKNVTAQDAVNVAVTNGNITMHDVTAGADASVTSSEQGSINAHNIVSAGITHVALSKGDLFLNLAEGKGVLLQMEDNTAASQVNQVLAEAGGQGTDVALTGNYVQIGTLAAKGGDAVLEVSAMGAGQQKLISGNFTIGSLSAPQGTHIPTLWSNRGSVHVAEGQLLLDDVLAVDKLYVDNAHTDMAIFGRTPTRDGQQLTYWNNLSMADSKARGYQLYTDGRVRTYGTVLFDAGMNLSKLDGDNLSVLDMMNERETSRHGVFTFERRLFTEPGKRLLEQVIFDPKMWDFAGRQLNEAEETATDKEE